MFRTRSFTVKTGILGTGNIGTTLIRRLSTAGHEVKAANSRDPETIEADVLASGGSSRSRRRHRRRALSVPFARIAQLAPLTTRRAFHQALYRASHNDVLTGLLDDLWDKSDRYRRLGLDLPPGDEPRTRDLQEHHQLVDLIEDGRAAEATQLMRDHIAHSLTATAISALEDRDGAHTT